MGAVVDDLVIHRSRGSAMTSTAQSTPPMPRDQPPRSPRSRVSVLFGQQVDDCDPLVRHGRVCAARDVRLWLGQSMTVETHLALATLAGRGIHLDVGLGVAVAPLTTPALAWAQAASLARLSGRSVAAGYGIGSRAVAEAARGAPLEAPARWMRRFVAELDAMRLADQGAVAARVELGCGVLRPAMAREAAQVADFVVTWLTPHAYVVGTVLPALADGAATAGRPAPRLVSIVPCAVRRPGRNPVRLAAVAVGQHLRAPHYAAMLRRAGVDLRGDRGHDLRATLSTGVFVYGSAEEVASSVRTQVDTGADEVVLNVGAVGLVHGAEAAVADLGAVLDAVAAGWPSPASVGIGG
ncbi:MAG: LLM class flavin-dependent oxidoreductase [Dermatophilaceae bacterium]